MFQLKGKTELNRNTDADIVNANENKKSTENQKKRSVNGTY